MINEPNFKTENLVTEVTEGSLPYPQDIPLTGEESLFIDYILNRWINIEEMISNIDSGFSQEFDPSSMFFSNPSFDDDFFNLFDVDNIQPLDLDSLYAIPKNENSEIMNEEVINDSINNFSISNNPEPVVINDCLLSDGANEFSSLNLNDSLSLTFESGFPKPNSNQIKNSRSVLKMPTPRRSVLRKQVRPETPQSQSECEEESKDRFLFHASEVTGQTVTPRVNKRSSYERKKSPGPSWAYILNDHSYHLLHRIEYLGVQTPSDSEEEIDVVSYSGNSTATADSASKNSNNFLSRNVGSTSSNLPTNPSPNDQHQLQLKMEKAIVGEKRKSDETISPRPRKRKISIDSDFEKESLKKVKLKNNESFSTRRIKYNKKPDYIYEVKPVQGRRTRSKDPHNNTENACDSRGDYFKTPEILEKQSTYRKNIQSTVSTLTPRHHPDQPVSSSAKRKNMLDTVRDSIERRKSHNNLERQRRITLSKLVDNLRRCIFGDSKKGQRMSKVVILNKAGAVVRELQSLHESLLREEEYQMEKQRILQDRVCTLRRVCFNSKVRCNGEF